MEEYEPCKKPDPTAQKAIGNVMRETKHRITGAPRRGSTSKEIRKLEECENDVDALSVPSVQRGRGE